MTPLARLLSLRADLRDEVAAAEVTPAALVAYAERTGWTLLREDPERRVYRRGAGELHVPRSSGWPAYGRAVLAELAELAAAEGRSSLAVWADLVGLASKGSPEPTRADADCRAVEAPSRGDRSTMLPSVPPEPAQGVLPGVPSPTRRRRRAVHRWGVIAPETLPPDPLDPERPHVGLVQRCPHCTVLRRRANTGLRLGAEDMYSTDGGQSWSYANPACVRVGVEVERDQLQKKAECMRAERDAAWEAHARAAGEVERLRAEGAERIKNLAALSTKLVMARAEVAACRAMGDLCDALAIVESPARERWPRWFRDYSGHCQTTTRIETAMTAPATLTEEEAQAWGEWVATIRPVGTRALAQEIATAVLAASRGDIPDDVRPLGQNAHGIGSPRAARGCPCFECAPLTDEPRSRTLADIRPRPTLTREQADSLVRAGWCDLCPHREAATCPDKQCPKMAAEMAVTSGEDAPDSVDPADLTPAEQAEVIASAPGQIGPRSSPPPAFRLCVAALVTDPADRVLLVRTDRGWEIPGGGVHEGEKPMDAAIREVKEETGIEVSFIGGSGKIWGTPKPGATYTSRILLYRARAEGEPRAGSDAQEARWIDAALVLDAHTFGYLSDLASRAVLLAWAREQTSGAPTLARRMLDKLPHGPGGES